jgi:DNA-binding transcriptional LysR family regulator
MVEDRRNGDMRLRSRATSAIDFQHLRYAASAAELGSFRRAAEALHLRQSTLSRCIRQLEESIGMILFERSSGGVRTTPTGRDFLRTAGSILEQVEALVMNSHYTGRGESGRLAIGFYTSLSAGNLRASLMDVGQRFPQIEIEMLESSRTFLVTALRNAAVDIAIVPGATPLPGTKTMSLWSERMMVAIPESHSLAGKDAVYWIDLRNERLLLSQRDPGPELQDLLVAKLASPGDRPNIVRHDVSRGSLKSLVGAGFGVTLLTEASAGANVTGVVYREVRDGAEPARIGYSAHWRADNENPALTSFLKILGERYPLPAADV